MNIYEALFFNHRLKLKKEIKNLIMQKISDNGIEPTELTEINKVINYSYSIQDDCNFVPSNNCLEGYKIFETVDDYLGKAVCSFYKNEIDYFTNKIEWKDHPGTLTWCNHPLVIVSIQGLIQHCVSIEARVKYLTSKNKEKQDYYAREIDLLNLDNLKLQEELAASI